MAKRGGRHSGEGSGQDSGRISSRPLGTLGEEGDLSKGAISMANNQLTDRQREREREEGEGGSCTIDWQRPVLGCCGSISTESVLFVQILSSKVPATNKSVPYSHRLLYANVML